MALRRLALAVAAALPLLLSLPAGAQSDADRAKRDAEKVFSFIKFHAVKRPAGAATPAPPATPSAASPAPAKPAAAAVAAPAAASEPAPAPPPVTRTLGGPAPLAASDTARPEAAPTMAPGLQASGLPGNVATPSLVAAAADEEEAQVRLKDFVAPQLSPSLLATLGAGMPRVRLRFTIEPDGRVSRAEAKEGTPRRLAVVAERALLQWRFEPLPAAQEVEVELAFQRD